MSPLPRSLSNLLGAAGDLERERTWRAFVAEYSRLLLHVARKTAKTHDEAMDAYAVLLEQLNAADYKRLRKYAEDGRSKFTTWLVMVARRLCLDHYRQRFGRTRDHEREETVQDREFRRRLHAMVGEELDTTTVADRTIDPESWVRNVELHEALEAALATLGATDRLLLKLRFEDDLSAQKIADLMRFPSPFHVYRRLNALTVTLRASLTKRGVESASP